MSKKAVISNKAIESGASSKNDSDFQELPENDTLCQILAWLFHSSKEAKKMASEFYKLRLYWPNMDSYNKETLSIFCTKHSKYLKYSRQTEESEAFIQATGGCQTSCFKGKLRSRYSLIKRPEDLWSLEATISDQDIDRIKALPFNPSPPKSSSLEREWFKRFSSEGKEAIYNDATLKQDLLSGFTIAFKQDLATMAIERKMTTTHLAQALIGRSILLAPDDTEITDPVVKEIYRQSRECKHQDGLFGYLIDSDATNNMKHTGRHGENIVSNDLDMMGISKDYYLTEEQQSANAQLCNTAKSSNEDNAVIPTPDFLFHTPVLIFDREIRWIEVKNHAIVPGISSDERIKDLQDQVKSYEKHHGCGGMLVILKEGFTEELRSFLPNTLIVTRKMKQVLLQQEQGSSENGSV